MEIIKTIDVFVHFIYLHQYPVKKTAAHWKFEKKLNPKWPPSPNYAKQKKKKNVSPIVQPLAHPKHTKRIAKKLYQLRFTSYFNDVIFYAPTQVFCENVRSPKDVF
jgi:hypothetical protein